jgi:hypothetical protein
MTPMVPVQSSMLESVGYDAAQRVLNVRFKRSAYVHPTLDVPPEIHAELMAAPSIGRAYNELVRGKFTPGSPVQVSELVGEEAEAIEASA